MKFSIRPMSKHHFGEWITRESVPVQCFELMVAMAMKRVRRKARRYGALLKRELQRKTGDDAVNEIQRYRNVNAAWAACANRPTLRWPRRVGTDAVT